MTRDGRRLTIEHVWPELHAAGNHIRYAYDALTRALEVFKELEELARLVDRARTELRYRRLKRTAEAIVADAGAPRALPRVARPTRKARPKR